MKAGGRGGILVKLIALLVVLAAGAVLAWILFLPTVMAGWVKRETGFTASLPQVMANPFGWTLLVRNARVENAAGFPVRGFLELRRVEAAGSPVGWLKGGRELREVTVEVEVLTVVVDAMGRMNAQVFVDGVGRVVNDAGRPPWRIGRLVLEIDRIVLIDHRWGEVSTRELRPRVRRELRDVARFSEVWDSVVLPLLETGPPVGPGG